MTEELVQEKFFEEFNVNKQEFEEAKLDWETLVSIYNEHKKQIYILETAANTIAEILRAHSDVHTVRSRVKHPSNLVEKIIRKTIKKQKEDAEYQVSLEDYTVEITDLIGIRVLHLYKDQAFSIDKKIREIWELYEKATINHREGDISKEFIEENKEFFDFNKHEAGYRSWHYLIETKITRHNVIAEIQVRTIFEEGWSEIDHQLRYPYDLDNVLLKSQLLVLNRLAGSADEMVNTIKETRNSLKYLEKVKNEQEEIIESLKNEIRSLSKNKGITEEANNSLQKKLEELERKQTPYIVSGNFDGGLTYSPQEPYLTNASITSHIIAKGEPITIRDDYGYTVTGKRVKPIPPFKPK